MQQFRHEANKTGAMNFRVQTRTAEDFNNKAKIRNCIEQKSHINAVSSRKLGYLYKTSWHTISRLYIFTIFPNWR